MAATKLKSCPFCGSLMLLVMGKRPGLGKIIVCEMCGSEGPDAGTADQAKKAWNTRVPNKLTETQQAGIQQALISALRNGIATNLGGIQLPDGTFDSSIQVKQFLADIELVLKG